MNSRYIISAALLGALCFASNSALADEYTETPAKLKTNGIDAAEVHITNFSHDGSFLIMHQRNTPQRIREGYGYKCFLVYLNPISNRVESVKTYELPVATFEFAALTPDQKDLIIITKSGATFLKLNLESGEISVLQENKENHAAFRAFPSVLHTVDDEMFCTGYFHNPEGFSDVDCTATLDPNKEGVLAFNRIYDIQGMQVKMDPIAWVYTRTNLGFFCVDKAEGQALMLEWNPPNDAVPFVFDAGKAAVAMWGSKDRLLYSIQREDGTYDLVVYDAATGQKSFIDKGNKDKYFNLFLSADSKTALFTDTNHRLERAAYFYADEDNGWKLTPVYDFHGKTRPFGEVRISKDGKKMAINSSKGLIIANVKP